MNVETDGTVFPIMKQNTDTASVNVKVKYKSYIYIYIYIYKRYPCYRPWRPIGLREVKSYIYIYITYRGIGPVSTRKLTLPPN
jgi:hypothetical protein